MLSLGEQIKKIRKEHSLTQIEFGQKICLSQSHLSRIEHDQERPSKAVIKLISILFNVDEYYLQDSNDQK